MIDEFPKTAEAVAKGSLEATISSHNRVAFRWSPPRVYDLSNQTDMVEVEQLFEAGSIAQSVDQATLIANDLFELRYPDKKQDQIARQEFVGDIQARGLGFGKWIYFPWSSELIRYPDQNDHRDLRTSRNRNLVNDYEQKRLYGARIAVFGLSVGSKVVDQLVESGIGGTLMIGDPDYITPTNLNRIRSGFRDVGTQKIDRTARNISEADPFIRQLHFREGANENTFRQLAENRPDIIFDEVDDLQTKAAIRVFAQKEGIPVIMVTDLGEKSIVDIERYDLGDTVPFGGRLTSSEFKVLYEGRATPSQLKRFTIKIVGIRHLTTRLLDSVMDIDKTLTGLPQLGSTASSGGSLATSAAREIILKRSLPSGRSVESPREILKLQRPEGISTTLRTLWRFATSMALKNA